jgi:Flp pilus assembly protein TadD
LRRGLATLPRDADLHHALGLSLTRQGDKPAARREFAEAARLAPDNARYAYVQAIAVHSAGQREQALALLQQAGKRHPNNLDILAALLSMSREAGDRRAALRYAKQLDGIMPGNADLGRLIAELEKR